MQEVLFNLNDAVKVKLTEHGIEKIRKNHDDLNDSIIRRGGRGLAPFSIEKDDEGYTKFQLWDLMDTFGSDIGITKKLPFETNIKLLNVND